MATARRPSEFTSARAARKRVLPDSHLHKGPGPGSAVAGRASDGRGGASLPEASASRLGGAAAATLERNVEVAPARRRGGGECWESPTGAALTQEPVAGGPRQVRPPVPSRSLCGSWGLGESPGPRRYPDLGLLWSPPACGPVSGGGAPGSSFRARRDSARRHGCFGDRAGPHPPTFPPLGKSTPEP